MASESEERVVEREKNGTSRIAREWEGERWEGIERPYTADDVARLRGSIRIEHTLAQMGAERLWTLMRERPYVRALGALTGNQAVQQVKAGLEAIYLSGWQVAADANLAGQMYPDQSLYPADSVPHVVRRINQALTRADQVHHAEGHHETDWFAPIVADAEAGFGGALNVFELMKAMIEAGAAGGDLDDARTFADAIHERFPGKLLAYNCSPSFNWRAKLPEDEIRAFQDELATMGYRFQFVTLAGF